MRLAKNCLVNIKGLKIQDGRQLWPNVEKSNIGISETQFSFDYGFTTYTYHSMFWVWEILMHYLEIAYTYKKVS